MSIMTQVGDATGRITLRRRRDRRKRWLWVGLAAGVLALLAGLGWLVFWSDVLGVRTIDVQGNRIVNAEDVRRLAEVPNGTPLVRVDLDGVATRVGGLPAVDRVTVARSWPNTISIQVVERTPLFAIETPGGYWIADAQGVIFQSATEAPKGLMVASVAGNDPALVRDLGTVLSALPSELRSQVKQVSAETGDSITVYLAGSTRVIWGSAEQSDLKAQVIVALLKQKGSTYDVSAPSNPTVR
ncbi:cell division protein FtsQ/DivIB [Micropruina sp.]|uniref:cell division protein FtsQ/DivIB n=1 Tax=Micropruina sp. TaxID=2737536 RepID=UPI0039E64431